MHFYICNIYQLTQCYLYPSCSLLLRGVVSNCFTNTVNTDVVICSTQLYKTVVDMIVAEKWEQLLGMDELNREIASGRILNGFIPLQPHWPPTFKRTRDLAITSTGTGTNKHYKLSSAYLRRISLQEMNASSNKKEAVVDGQVTQYYHIKRLPSYTDRILYKSLPAFREHNRALFFDSVEAATSSDHKPVQAGFELKLCGGTDDIRVDTTLLQNQKYSEHKVGRCSYLFSCRTANCYDGADSVFACRVVGLLLLSDPCIFNNASILLIDGCLHI